MTRPIIILKFVIFALMSTLLIGCKMLPDFQFSPNILGKIQSTDVYILVPQKEISAKVKSSQLKKFGAGAITFAVLAIADSVVDKSRNTKAKENTKPLQKILMDVNFADIFHQQLTNELAKNEWLNIQNIELISDVEDHTKQTLFEQSQSDAVLFLTTSYYIGGDFSSLSASAMSELLPKSTSLKYFSENPNSSVGKKDALHPSNHLFRETVSVNLDIPGANSEDALNLRYLTDNQSLLQEKLVELASVSAIKTNDSFSQLKIAANAP